MGFRVKVGFKDSVGVQIGQNFPSGTFGVHGASGALGAHGRLRATPLATNCWPKAPRGGGGGWHNALVVGSAYGGAYWPLAFEPSAMTSRQSGGGGLPHWKREGGGTPFAGD